MSNQPPPPFGDQPQPGGWGPQGNPTQPFPQQGQPPGYGQQPPGGYGAPPSGYGQQPPGGGYGAPPPGFGGPGGFQGGPPPKSSNAPVIVGVVAAVLILGGAVGAFLLLGGDDDPVAVSTPTATPTAADTAEPTPTAAATATETPAPTPEPTATMPAPPPTPDASPTAPPPQPAAPGSSMDMGEGLTGEITPAALEQDYFFDGLAGEEIVLTMTALDDSLDPVLTLFGPDGAELARNDDDFDLPNSTDSRITFQLPVDGEYRVQASSFAETTGRFQLTLEFPSVLSDTDTLSAATPEILYDYDGVAGETIIINMRTTDDVSDPLVRVLDPSGNEIGRDDDGGGFPNARLQLTLPVDGTYTIIAGVFSERYGAYEITLSSL